MTTYQNTTPAAGIDTAIGNPTLGATGDSVHLVTGTSDYTTELDQLAGVVLDQFFAFSGYGGDIGTNGASLQVDSPDVRLFWSGRRASIAGVATKTIGSLVHAPAANGALFLSAATVTNLTVAAGSARLASNVAATTLRAVGGQTTVEAGATTTTVSAGGAGTVVTLENDPGTVNVSGGATAHAKGLATTPTTVAVNGGTYKHQGGNIGTLTVDPGGATLDYSDLSQNISVTTMNLNGPVRIIRPKGPATGWHPDDAGTLNDNAKLPVIIV